MGGDYKEIAISEGRVRPEGEKREERRKVGAGPERR